VVISWTPSLPIDFFFSGLPPILCRKCLVYFLALSFSKDRGFDHHLSHVFKRRHVSLSCDGGANNNTSNVAGMRNTERIGDAAAKCSLSFSKDGGFDHHLSHVFERHVSLHCDGGASNILSNVAGMRNTERIDDAAAECPWSLSLTCDESVCGFV
jgi:hypothetical protein